MNTLTLLTSGAKRTMLLPIAFAAGVPLSGFDLKYQQDIITRDGHEALPRIWHEGLPDAAIKNGGLPGHHNHLWVQEAAYMVTPTTYLDIEPENWQTRFKSMSERFKMNAVDVVKTLSAGSAGVAFFAYRDMVGSVNHFDFLQDLPHVLMDSYLYDSPNGLPWSKVQYEAEMRGWLDVFASRTPNHRVRALVAPSTSGEYRPNTDAECTMIGDVLNDIGIHNRYLWVRCDTNEDIDNARRYVTTDRVKRLRGD